MGFWVEVKFIVNCYVVELDEWGKLNVGGFLKLCGVEGEFVENKVGLMGGVLFKYVFVLWMFGCGY